MKSINPSAPTIIIVDCYSSGRFFPPLFRQEGYQVVHIHSVGKPHFKALENTFLAENFDLDIAYKGDLTLILNQLSIFKNVVGVIPGSDPGVLFADELCTALHRQFPSLPCNGIDASRKDKFLQNEKINVSGIDSAQQIKTNDVREAVEWVIQKQLLTQDPKIVVVKPLRSGSTDGVFMCRSVEEIETAIRKLLWNPDEFGQINTEVLLQEFLTGDEYAVDTTTRDGHTIVTDIWKYHKSLSPDGMRYIYDYDLLLPYEGNEQKTLVAYTRKVIEALGIRHGNGHCEIKLVPKRGPVLIEMNNRMAGSGIPKAVEASCGHSQIDRTILAYTAPHIFKNLGPEYTRLKCASLVTLVNTMEGCMINPTSEEAIRALPAYHSHSFNFDYGQPMKRTIDLNSAIGMVTLVHLDSEILKRSIQELRLMNTEGKLVAPM